MATKRDLCPGNSKQVNRRCAGKSKQGNNMETISIRITPVTDNVSAISDARIVRYLVNQTSAIHPNNGKSNRHTALPMWMASTAFE